MKLKELEEYLRIIQEDLDYKLTITCCGKQPILVFRKSDNEISLDIRPEATCVGDRMLVRELCGNVF